MSIYTTIHHYLENLKERERRMLWIGGIIILTYFMYLGIYHPISQALRYHQKTLIQLKTTLAFMEDAQKRIESDKKFQPITVMQLLTKISHTLSQSPFDTIPHALQQQENNEIHLHFDSIPYLLFNQWLWELEKDNPQSNILKINIEKTEKVGVVTVDLTVVIRP